MEEERHVHYDPSADYYRVLAVSPAASIDEIHRVFRRRAKEVHPDVNPTRRAWAHLQFERINAAYDVLGDPELRADYDRLRFAYLSQAFSGPSASQVSARRSARQKANSHTQEGRRKSNWGVVVGVIILLTTLARLGDLGKPDTNASVYVPQAGLLPTMTTYTKVACDDPNVQITEPKDGKVVFGPLVVRGTAAGAGFKSYSLETGLYFKEARFVFWDPSINEPFGLQGDQPVTDGTLGVEPSTDLISGLAYILRLTVRSATGVSRQCDVAFSVPGMIEATATRSLTR
ncbi:MAG TPA: J domain-containing protein [Aggregatilineaceae bacterium]|nr:J domain-containing protein [Aggregatilineaceae bacterium]